MPLIRSARNGSIEGITFPDGLATPLRDLVVPSRRQGAGIRELPETARYERRRPQDPPPPMKACSDAASPPAPRGRPTHRFGRAHLSITAQISRWDLILTELIRPGVLKGLPGASST
ncbi:uncharacterized protein SCHCODRAFT_02492904 [Schizophyllum commune H4-8]|uniref:uncharacterized protein n=1 Tax=Schizophyllum commune (strain H4-8 / FGSC 9210) TaxID=578458 RepID=UPI00215DF1D1|nr:uncharacterized protein SCHCODRAFT_02492904 [Schizophyllum commune H4-8]KAI5896977.1 hypothetical protein SCHCODRAFT_02492904 [Schizophyllum commune H4-8]